MPDPAADILQALQRFIEKQADSTDLALLAQAKGEGRLVLAAGERSVAIGGDVSHSVVVTGDTHVELSGEAYERLLAQLFPKALHTLRAPVADFTGREDEISQLLAGLTAGDVTALISGIRGMGGVGKTELALVVAHRLAPHYPNAQLLIDLQPGDRPATPESLLSTIIRAFDPLASLPDSLPELQPLYRAQLHGKRGLLLLDNADSAAQLRPLLPPPAGWAALVTSRRHLPLASASLVNLNVLPDGDACALLKRLLNDGGRTPTDEQLTRLANLCGYLPLALRLAAGYLTTYSDWSIEEYAEALQAERLAHLKIEGESVATVLGLSVSRLEDEDAGLALRWRKLAVFPAPFDRTAAATVWDLPEPEARTALSALLQQSLVDYDSPGGTYSLHDLLREYALQSVTIGEAVQADDPSLRMRHAEHYLDVGVKAEALYLEGGKGLLRGLREFDGAWPHLEQAWEWLENQQSCDRDRWLRRFVVGLPNLLSLRCHPRQRIAFLEPALKACSRLQDTEAECAVLGSLGNAYADLGDARTATHWYEPSLAAARAIGNLRYVVATLTNLGNMARVLGAVPLAISRCQEALATARQIGDRRAELKALGSLASGYSELGHMRQAVELYEQTLQIAEELADPREQAIALGNIGHVYNSLGGSKARQAVAYFGKALAIYREIGDRHGESTALGNLATVYALPEHAQQAICCCEEAVAISQEIGDRRGEAACLSSLGAIHSELGDQRKAIGYHEQAIKIARDIGDRFREAIILGNLGSSYQLMHDLPRATECYQLALAIDQEIGNRWSGVTDAWNLGLVFVQLGRFAEAVQVMRARVEYLREIGHPDAEGDAQFLEEVRQKAQADLRAADDSEEGPAPEEGR